MKRIILDYQSRRWLALEGVPDKPQGAKEFATPEQIDYLARCLADADFLLADLEIAETKQDRFPTKPTPRTDGSESPLPYRQGAVNASTRLRSAIYGVSGVIWFRATQGKPYPFGRDTGRAAVWLRSNLKLVAQDYDAERHVRRIADAHDRALAGPVEHPPSWRYLGRCEGCGHDLHAESGADRIQCDCGWTATVAELVERALKLSEAMLFTDSQLVGALELDGKIVTRKRIRYWADHGRLTVHRLRRWAPYAGKIVTVRTYRLGEVRDLLADLERHDDRSSSTGR